MANPAQGLHPAGQSVWYDDISRDLVQSGELKRLIAEWGVRGLTSNPSIFDAALKEGTAYDEQISSLKGGNYTTAEVFEELAIQDIAAAADVLRSVYEESKGVDGYCSIEVSPTLAHQTDATIEEAKRLFSRLKRDNIMVKIPGTPEGLPAIRACLEAGININVTLLFSVENYVAVAKTYCEALNARLKRGEPVDGIQSVASFFVSRVDSIVDSKLDEIASNDAEKKERANTLKGAFGIANSKLAYQAYLDIFEGESFRELKQAGAAVQRPLWASTSTKDPSYRDVMYVEELIGANTVNTMPRKTLEAFVDHGEVKPDSVVSEVEAARELQSELNDLGVDLSACLEQLQKEGVEKFVASFDALHASLEEKLK